MLVSPMQNSHVGGLNEREVPTREFWVAVEYRLNCISVIMDNVYLEVIDIICLISIKDITHMNHSASIGNSISFRGIGCIYM